MKRLSAAVLTLALTIALASAFTRSTSSATSQPCECSAPDGSCSASASCTTGCEAVCPSDGCTAHCSGYYEFLQTEVTLQMQNATSKQLVAELARVSGKEVAFSSVKPDVPFNLDVKRAAIWDVLEILSNNGTLLVAGEDFERLRTARRALLSGEKVSLCVHNTPVSALVTDLANLSGLPIRITTGNTRATVDLKLQGVTLKDILTQVSEQTGAKITYEDPDSGAH
jgi:hypothetical protein